jgi:TatD DNase family protein
VIAILQEMKHPLLRGIFHCFSGNAQQAKQITELGFHLGIGGVLTYKKSELPDAIADIDLQHLVLETDAPYLTPTPHRGRVNASYLMPYTVRAIAERYLMAEADKAAAKAANASNDPFAMISSLSIKV